MYGLCPDLSPPKPLDQSKNVTVRTYHNLWEEKIGQKLAKKCQKTPKRAKICFSLGIQLRSYWVMVNYEQWSWPDQTVLPDLAKSCQSDKNVLPELAKSRQTCQKVPKWRKRVSTGFQGVQTTRSPIRPTRAQAPLPACWPEGSAPEAPRLPAEGRQASFIYF